MSELTSTKPYLIRAIHEWCTDNGLTPHLMVSVDEGTRVPMAYVRDGEIVLNINYSATKDLMIANDAITFSARFGGVANELYIPMCAVRGVFARENGQGMFFQPELEETLDSEKEKGVEGQSSVADENKKTDATKKKPFLKLVK
jgi:stringent starvation protein B